MSQQPAPENKTMGMACSAAGVVFTLLGVLLFFNSALLALGNIFLVVGVGMLVGGGEVYAFAMQQEKRKGSLITLGGFILVLYKWGLVGLLVEAYGFFELFGDLAPQAHNLIRQLPILGQFITPPAPAEQRPQTLAAQFANQLLGSLGQPQKAGEGAGAAASVAQQYAGALWGGLSQLAEAAFDTPRAYYAQAAAGGASDREDRGWPPVGADGEGEEEEPPHKKRKGLAGAALGSVLDAAIFATALGYTAFRLWRDPPSAGNEDVDTLLRSRAGRKSNEAPPPYAEHIPRRVRHAHQTRPSSFRHPSRTGSDAGSSTSTAFEPYALSIPPAEPDPFQPAPFPQLPLPEFHPFRKFSGAPPPGALDDDSDDDAEMQSIAERMKALIESGRSALMSAPPVLDSSDALSGMDDEEGERPMPLPVVAPSRMSRAAGPAPKPKSAASHQRRQSASAAIGPTHSFAASKKAASLGRRSLGGEAHRTSGHQPKSSRGGSLGHFSDVRAREKVAAAAAAAEGSERGNVQVLEGVLERTSQIGGKGWWET
ncbi:hypothetical protein RQP46_004860 [Phenoliferia psychrophenolica]